MKQKLSILFGVSIISLSAFAQPDPGETRISPRLQDELEQAKVTQPALSDAQILGFMQSVNDAEVSLAKAHQNRGSSAQSKEFAKEMANHHRWSNEQLNNLSRRLNVKPEKSVYSDEVQSNARIAEVNLDRGIHPDNRDSAYINKQIEMHAKVLDRLDNTLIPQAKSEDLKTFLQNSRSTINSHLSQARAVQRDLSNATAQNSRQ